MLYVQGLLFFGHQLMMKFMEYNKISGQAPALSVSWKFIIPYSFPLTQQDV
jgi:hypothetical protein